MPQFYFRHRQSPSPSDDTPYTLSGIDEALAEANHRARRVLSRLTVRGEVVRGSIDVENERHSIVAQVLLSETARQMA